jgi:hypothetical protein
MLMARIVPEGGFQLQPFRRPRVKVESHRLFIKRLPCCVCGSANTELVDPAHIRAASAFHGKRDVGAGETADDRWILPQCRNCHDQQHREVELEFWRRHGIDPFLLALILWGLTGDEYEARQVIVLHAGRAA